MKNGEPLWTIDELSEAVATALAEGYDGSPNGRVRDVPDRRTIRYYTTLGLIDRPAEMRGRTALYGRRHLLQLVAIKKLQARGQSLVEVQRTLTGQSDQALAEVAGLNEGGRGGEAGPTPIRRATRDFWREAPAPHVSDGRPVGGGGQDGETWDRLPESTHIGTFHGVSLVDGVTLLLASSRPLDGQDLEAIRAAAAPLIGILARRQLIPPREQGESP